MALTKLNFSGSGQGALATSDLPTGSVIQVVGDVNATNLSQVGDTTNMEAGISKTITPSSTSNKILVLGAIELNLYAVTRVDATVDLVRTVGGVTASALDYNTLYNLHGSGTYYPYHSDKMPFMFLDSPSTTSEITYSIRFRQGTSSGTIYACTANSLGQSNMILQEIKG